MSTIDFDAALNDFTAGLTGIQDAINVTYFLLCAVLVFFMQCGFGMLEAGVVQRKNTKNILLKNIADTCMAAICFWLFGFGISYGGNGKFMGDTDYFGGDCLSGECGEDYLTWFFQYAFAATAATIVSGAVAERTQFGCYLVYSSVITILVYPTVVHWVWGGGFLAEEGVHDFAGSGVVHMVGGCAGMIGAMVIGPRKGRFTGDRFNVTVNSTQSNSVIFLGLGVFILWTGWYGFNTGSTLGIVGNEADAKRVVINTTLAPASAGVTCLFLSTLMYYMKTGEMVVKPEPMLNGVLGGLVSITAGCACMRPGYAFLVGIIGGAVYLGSSHLLIQLKIDDVLDAAPVHFFCGIWGVMAVGLFAEKGYSSAGHGWWIGGDGDLLGWQLVEVIVVTLWTVGWTLLVFVPMSKLGLARVTEEVEEMGLDVHHHGGDEIHISVALEHIKNMTKSSLAVPDSNANDAL